MRIAAIFLVTIAVFVSIAGFMDAYNATHHTASGTVSFAGAITGIAELLIAGLLLAAAGIVMLFDIAHRLRRTTTAAPEFYGYPQLSTPPQPASSVASPPPAS